MTTASNNVATAIETVVAQARSVYQRTRGSGPRYSDVTSAVRALHSALRDLHGEAQDPDSLLSATTRQYDSVYSQQLRTVLQDSRTTLQQLDDILSKYGPRRNSATDYAAGPIAPDDFLGREEDVLSRIQAAFSAQTASISTVLHSVQSPDPAQHHPESTLPPISPEGSSDDEQGQDQQGQQGQQEEDSQAQIEAIKAKVDAVAARLLASQDLVGSLGSVSLDDLWRTFHFELIYEGCSAEILTKHKDALRGYLQEAYYPRFVNPQKTPLSEKQTPPPSPRNVAAMPAARDPRPSMPSSARSERYDGISPREVVQSNVPNEKFQPSIKENRPTATPFDGQYIPYHPRPAVVAAQQNQWQPPSWPPQTQQDVCHHPPSPPQAVLNQGVGSPKSQAAQAIPPMPSSPSPSYTTRDSISFSSDDGSTDRGTQDVCLVSTKDILLYDKREQEQIANGSRIDRRDSGLEDMLQSTASTTELSASPRYTASRPVAAFGIVLPAGSSPPTYSMERPASPALAPDSRGNTIPPDAVWTKISRRLVSPEVLQKAGVRYEARPSFVAVLGKLERTEVEDFALQSAEARKLRHRQSKPKSPRSPGPEATFAGSTARLNRMQTMPTPPRESSSTLSSDEPARICKAQTFPVARPPSRQNSSLRSDDRACSEDSSEGRRSFAYPFIVSPPESQAGDSFRSQLGAGKGDDRPKSILKNKNMNELRYKHGKTIEVHPDEEGGGLRDHRRHKSRSRSRRERQDYSSDSDSDKSRHERRRHGDRDRSRRREERSRVRDGNYSYERDRSRNRDRNRDRDRDRDRDHDRSHESRRRRYSDAHEERERERDRRDRDRDRDRGRDRDRDRDRYHRSHRSGRDSSQHRRDDRDRLRDTISTAGITGVAASILTALSEGL